MKNLVWIGCLILSLLFGWIPPVFCVSEVGMLFLLISPSPQLNGMSEVYLNVGNPDPFGPIYNPALVGHLAQENQFSGAFYPTRTQWLPNLTSDIYYSAKTANFGINLGNFLSNLPLTGGIGVHAIKLDLGEQVVTGETGPEPIATIDSYDRSWGVSVGAAVDYYIQASVGFTYKHITSKMASFGAGAESSSMDISVSAVDWGLFLHLPVVESFSKLTDRSLDILPGFRPFLTNSFSFSQNNIGDEIIYIDVNQRDPLPRVARIGYGFETGLMFSNKKIRNWKMVSFEWGVQEEDVLVERSNIGEIGYQSGLGDINFFNDLVLGRENEKISKMKGWGFNLFEIGYFRFGHHEDVSGKVRYNTTGFGISTRGLTNYLHFTGISFSGPHPVDKIINFMLHHLELEYFLSEIDAGSGNPLGTTQFQGINIIVY